MTFTLTHYFDVWTDEEGSFIVNNAAIQRRNIDEKKIDTDQKIMKLLKAEGLIPKGMHARSILISYSSDMFFEVMLSKNYYPICSFSADLT